MATQMLMVFFDIAIGTQLQLEPSKPVNFQQESPARRKGLLY
jgi:hypothetical protein